MQHTKKQLFYLVIIIATIYTPSIFADVCLLDDREMLNALSGMQRFDLYSVFFPKNHSGLYYRPLIITSFMADRFLWNLEPSIMRFENILLHLASSILIYFSTRLITSKYSILPIIAALLFGLHPIATESVNWISGRTDLLAVMFILISLYTILHYKISRHFHFLCISFVTLFLAVLSKETAIGFIPAAIFILAAKDYAESPAPEQKTDLHSWLIFACMASVMILTSLLLFNYYIPIALFFFYLIFLIYRENFQINSNVLQKVFFLVCSCPLILWFCFWGMRNLAFSSPSPHIQRTLQLIISEPNYTLGLFFKAVGFYAKKFLIPVPLNFVIRDVSPLYSLVGVFLLCLVAVLLSKRTLAAALAISGFCMIAPVLPLAFESIAWTSYADRYTYPAAPFWILAITGFAYASGFETITNRKKIFYLAGPILVFAVLFTVQRNFIWQTNLALFKDSVVKTPDYKPLRGLYMTALFEKGLYDEALNQYHIAQSTQSIQIKYNPNYELFYVQILIAKKRYKEAEAELEIIEKKTNGREAEVYERRVELWSHMILQTNDYNKNELLRKMTASYDHWFELTKNPMLLYRKGQLLLAHNSIYEAGKAFAAAAKLFPKDFEYRRYAELLATKHFY